MGRTTTRPNMTMSGCSEFDDDDDAEEKRKQKKSWPHLFSPRVLWSWPSDKFILLFMKNAPESRTFALLTQFSLATTSDRAHVEMSLVRPLLQPDSRNYVGIYRAAPYHGVRSCKGHCVSATASESFSLFFIDHVLLAFFGTYQPFDDNDHH